MGETYVWRLKLSSGQTRKLRRTVMDFEYTAQEHSFREEVKVFLKENLPPKKERGKNFLQSWLEKVREKGWVGFSWPKEYGGSDGGLIIAEGPPSKVAQSKKSYTGKYLKEVLKN